MGMGNICQSLFINILMIKFISQKCGHCGIVRRLPHFHVFCGHSYRSRALIFLLFFPLQWTPVNSRPRAMSDRKLPRHCCVWSPPHQKTKHFSKESPSLNMVSFSLIPKHQQTLTREALFNN